MDLRNKLSSLPSSPKKILKIVVGLSLVLLLMWLFTISQIDYGEGAAAGRYLSTETAEQNDTTVVANTIRTRPAEADSESSLFSSGMVTFLVLTVLLVGIWLWIDRRKGDESPAVQREIGSHVVGEGAQVKILRINNEIWVLGVTSTSIDLLHRYGEEEWTENVPRNGKREDDEQLFKKLFNGEMA